MKRKKYPINPDFKKWENVNPPLNRVAVPVMQKLLGFLFFKEKTSNEIRVERFEIPSFDGNKIKALLYTPKGINGKAPCLVYYHGGGFVFPAAPHHYKLIREYAIKTPCKVLFVNYRLAPKHPFPEAPGDCYRAYEWILRIADNIGIDPLKVAVGGDSAGGQLATVVCFMVKDRGLRIPCAQMLIYPVTSRELETGSIRKYVDTPMCNSRDMEKYDKYYIRDGKTGKKEYMSPVDAKSLEGMPPAYIETAEFDCLRDGGMLYAEKLKQFGVPVELYETKGTIHGFDIELDSQIVRNCVEKRIAFLKKSLKQA